MVSKNRKHKTNRAINDTCLSKVRHETRNAALETAIWQSEQEGCGVRDCCSIFDYYKCIFCEGYHTYRAK